jgi:anaerobic magnesium-protoporphyrin IX monomethyl ester cyclase
MLRVLFVHAADPVSEVENRYLPLWPSYLAASAQDSLGPDQAKFRLAVKSISHELDTFSPDLLGISAVSQNFGYALGYAAECKRRGIPVIVGGPHMSALPQCLSPEMDVGCIGEGEQTFVELLRLYLRHGEFRSEDLAQIKGVVYYDNGRLMRAPPRPLVESLDSIPPPDRSIIGYQRHSYMFTSRGCPYRCRFCASSRFWKGVRFASAERVVAEISELAANGSRMISFYDDLFIADKARLRKIGDLIVERELNKKVVFTCSCRANLVTEEVVRLLKRMNVVSVGMGLESGSDRTLAYLKGAVTVRDNAAAINALKGAGIQANASFVIGAPYETQAEIMETYHFIRSSRLDFVDAYVLTPLPGTPIWEFAEQRGLVSNDMDWSRLDVNFERSWSKAILLSQTLSRDEIVHLFRKFRRLRLIKLVKAVPRSPWLPDVPIVAAAAIKRMIWRLLRGKSS